jgi:hypothetical protein
MPKQVSSESPNRESASCSFFHVLLQNLHPQTINHNPKSNFTNLNTFSRILLQNNSVARFIQLRQPHLIFAKSSRRVSHNTASFQGKHAIQHITASFPSIALSNPHQPSYRSRSPLLLCTADPNEFVRQQATLFLITYTKHQNVCQTR